MRLARVERVAKPIPDVIDREHREKDHRAGEDRFVWSDLEPIFGLIEHAPPGWDVGREAKAEKGEGRLGDDRCADAKGGGDDDWAQDIRQDVPEHLRRPR